MENEEIEDGWDEALCSNIANLSGALSSLEEIDPFMMGEDGTDMLRKIKRRIFKAIYLYTQNLPSE